MSDQVSTSRVTGHRVKKIVASSFMHFVATLVLYTIFVAAFMTEHAFSLLGFVLRDAALASEAVSSLLIMFGLAACCWSLMFIIYQLGKLNIEASRRPNLQKARGTIITETLIILPIFFLLTFGLAQMALNSIAGLLTTLGTFEAARTAAVWGPEINDGRGIGISQALAEEKIRVAAAGVIAPATPNLASGATGCAMGTTLPRTLAGLAGGSDGGITSANYQPDVWSFIDALGYREFKERGPSQMTLAYCNTEVSWTPTINNNPKNTQYTEFTLTLRYHHPAVMPLVGPIFARNPGAGLWTTDQVSTMERSYRMSSYLTPNDCGPLPVMYPWSSDCD